MPQPFNREHILELLPLDLRPFVELHDFDEAFESYPFLGAMDDPKYPQCGSRLSFSIPHMLSLRWVEPETHSNCEDPSDCPNSQPSFGGFLYLC